MPVRIGVVVFPGSNCDRDTVHALELAGAEPVVLWHEQASLDGVAAVILPGGFAYGDYLRAGVIARFSPVMRAVAAFAADGGLVLGICNGFQVLAEAGLVPGALLRNASLRFAGQEVTIAAERLDTPFTHALDARPAAAHAGRPRRGLLLRRRRDARRARARRPGPVPLRRRRGRAGRTRRRRPTRTARCARSPGVMNARGQRRRADAASGAGRRRRSSGSDDGFGDRPLAGRERRASGATTGPVAVGPARGLAMTVAERPVEPLHRRLGVTDDELDAIRDRLGGRDPNDLELAMFSVMWSEHCSYKSSKPLLRTLPTAGEGVVAGPGENAGVISIGDGLAVAFKIESHNHPSAVEPYQGAATGVGGILRDIFTMGARPIAVLDALRFGDPADARTRHLVDGVVRGVGGYGNCVGVPTVGGELVFDPSYTGNPLVNVMAIGLLEERLLTLAAAPGPGNLVVLYGSATGRDGIGGASVLASATFTDDDPSKRPSVQVGDPFAEKLLIEASLELIERGLVEGLQDLGAGGITCATSETADRAGTGIVVDLDAIPRREPGLEPFEVMISESQERMCAAVLPRTLGGGPRGLRALGPAGRDHRPGHGRRRHRGRGGRPGPRRPARAGRPGARAHPGPALTSDAIVHQRVASRPDAPPRRPRTGRPGGGQRPPAGARDGPRRGAAGPARLAEPRLAPRGLPPVRLDGRGGHRRRPGSRRGRPAGQGHDQGARRHDRRQRRRRRVRPVAGRGAGGRRGDPQRLDHGRAAARRDELPQLRRPDPARGVLAADRGRPRPRRRLPGAGPARHRRQRLALQRVAGRGRSRRPPRSASSGCSTTSPRWSARPSRSPTTRSCSSARPCPGWPARPTPSSPGPPWRTTRRRSTSPARRRSRRSSARRSRAASWRRRRTSRAAGSASPSPSARCGAGSARASGSPIAHSPAVDLFGESPSRLVVTCRPRYAAALELLARQHGLPVETVGSVGGDRLRDRAGRWPARPATPRTAAVASPTRSRSRSRDLRHAWDHGLARALGWEG